MPSCLNLEERILAVLERALAEGQSEAAEHLLRALEALCGGASPGSPLAEAYRVAAQAQTPDRPPH